MKPFDDPDTLLTEDQAARLLGLSIRTLQGWRWREEGPPFVRIGPRCVRYRRSDLLQFAAQRLIGRRA